MLGMAAATGTGAGQDTPTSTDMSVHRSRSFSSGFGMVGVQGEHVPSPPPNRATSGRPGLFSPQVTQMRGSVHGVLSENGVISGGSPTYLARVSAGGGGVQGGGVVQLVPSPHLQHAATFSPHSPLRQAGQWDSPVGTPGSRPGSGRARAVQTLVDAVRSRDDGRFLETLEYLRLPNGGVAGVCNDACMAHGASCLRDVIGAQSLGFHFRLCKLVLTPAHLHVCCKHPSATIMRWYAAYCVWQQLKQAAVVDFCKEKPQSGAVVVIQLGCWYD